MEIKELLKKAMFEIARRLQNELMITCPVDTGFLKNHIKVIPYGKGLLIWMPSYGKFVEFGTPPHIIKPTEKKALKFEWTEVEGKMVGRAGRLRKGVSKAKARDVFFKQVRHPGTRPNPFIRTAINTKLRSIITEEIIRAQTA